MKKFLTTALLGFFMTTANAAKPVQVLLETSSGNITLELDAEKAPKTVANFVQYVNDKHYDGVVFHRVIKGFMIQGGGYEVPPQYKEKATRPSIENEAKNGLKNVKGSIAMARTSAPHSASAQFFINHKDNGFLDSPGQDGWGYCVFGKVIVGMDVVDKIADSPTQGGRPFGSDMPIIPVIINKASVVK